MAKKKTHVSKNTAHRRHQPSSRSSSRSLLTNPFVLIGLVAVLALVIWLVVTGTGSAGKENGLPATISVDEAYSLYQQGVFLLDVRENSEWDEFHVPDTTHIPLGELAERVDELPRDQRDRGDLPFGQPQSAGAGYPAGGRASPMSPAWMAV